MSEAVYTQVEDAIARHLHVMVPGGGVFGPGYRYPVGIDHGNIVMRDSDCGLARPVIVWTTDQWRTYVDESGRGLYKQVGFWSFEAADDPAANDIRLCHQSPGSAGRRLYEMRGEIERLRAERDEHARWRRELANKLHDREAEISDAWIELRASGVQSERCLADGVAVMRKAVQHESDCVDAAKEHIETLRAERDACTRMLSNALKRAADVEAEREELRRQLDPMGEYASADELIAALRAEKAEDEAMKLDAARYRWLCDHDLRGPVICDIVEGAEDMGFIPVFPDNIDAAIDAAMGLTRPAEEA